jgi:hypothetical protein
MSDYLEKIKSGHTMEAERQNHISASIDDYQERQAALRRYL